MIKDTIKATMMCMEAGAALAINEESLTISDEERDNCGEMSSITEFNDIVKANEKILHYIDSLGGKQRVVTSSQISKELGISQMFIEDLLVANGFEED